MGTSKYHIKPVITLYLSLHVSCDVTCNYSFLCSVKHRQDLAERNSDVLTDIDTCMFIVSLEKSAPKVQTLATHYSHQTLLVTQYIELC